MADPRGQPNDQYWLVLTPSINHHRWRDEIRRAASEAGFFLVDQTDVEVPPTGANLLFITEDAERAVESGASHIAAIVSEPKTSLGAVADGFTMPAAERDQHAAMLLARALSLSPEHRVVTDTELSQYPTEIAVFETLKLKPPAPQIVGSSSLPIEEAFSLYSALGEDLAEPVSWDASLFTYEPRSTRNSPGVGILDTTGGPRMMVSGPYLAMPPGRWQACIRFSVDPDAAKRKYRLDWGTRTACVSEHCVPNAAGVYELELDFVWTEVDVAEIRLILMEGSFTGTITFEGMTVRRIADLCASPQVAA